MLRAACAALLMLTLVACGGTGPSRVDTGNSGSGTPVKVVGSNAAQAHTLSVSANPTSGGTVISNPGGISCGTACSTNFVGGSTIALTVAPKTGFVFTGWGGACSGNGGCSVKIDADKTVTANFGPPPPAQATLSVGMSGSGSGAITSSPAGINCGATCSAQINLGTSVTLTATPAAGSAFAGWSGAVCAGTGTCTVSLTADTSVTALFVPQYNLSVTKGGTGSGAVASAPAGLVCGTSCSTPFAANTVVSLVATPTTGSAFTGWGGACSGTGSCTVTMASDQAVVANFGPPPTPQFNLAITLAGSGTGSVTSAPAGINCGTSCTAPFDSGSTITLTPVPAAGSAFSGWTGASCVGTAPCTITLAANTSVTATFVPLANVSLTVPVISGLSTGGGSISSSPASTTCTGTCTTSFPAGTVVNFIATPDPGYTFVSWGGSCSGTSTCQTTVTSSPAISIVANFAAVPPPQYALSVSLSGAGSGTVTSAPVGINCGATCTANFNSGTSVVLTPSAAAGSVFAGWSGACTNSSGTCTVPMTSAQSVSATFIPSAFPVTATVAGTGTGSVTSNVGGVNCPGVCSATINTGSTIVFTATPAAGSVFAGWTGDCTGTSTCSVLVGTAASAVTATFSPAPQNSLTVTKSGTGTGTVSSTDSNIACGATCTFNYNQGSSVTLNAVAAAGSTFTGWSGACTGTGSCTVTMNSVQLVNANFDTASFATSVTVAGSGTVTSSPAGISCTTGTCSTNFNSGTPVVLTATPSAGFVFTGWSGGTCTGTGTCSFTMPASAVNAGTATFTQQFGLTINANSGTGSGTVTSGDGLISCPGTCSATYLNGASVTLTATPSSAASTFVSWTGGGCGVNPVCTVSMTAAQSITPKFNIAQFPVTVMVTGSGSVSDSTTTIFNGCTGTCTVNVNSGTNITLNETPSSSTFAGWTGACSGTGACSFTIGTSPIDVGAAFSANLVLTVTKTGSGTGTVASTSDASINCGGTCSASYSSGTSVTLSATAGGSSVFTGWSGACTGTGACTVTMNSAQTVNANFDTASFATSVTVAGSGTVNSNPAGINCTTGTCSSNFSSGSAVILTATPAAGFVFTGWSGGSCSGTGSCSFTMPASAVNAGTATFTQKFALTVNANAGSGSGTVTSGDGLIACPGTCTANYLSGASVTLTAMPSSAASIFAGWTGGGCGVSPTCTVTMSSAQSVTPTFNIAQFPVTVTVSGAGSGTVTTSVGGISCPGTCSANINSGTLVTVSQNVSSSASTFAGWSGACTGVGACSFTVGTSAVAVGATFSPTPTYTLTVAESGTGTGTVISNVGTISCPGTCSNGYLQGTSVTLTAAATSGTSIFTGWSGACTNTTTTCTVTMNAAQSVSANFVPASYAVTVTTAGAGSGSVTSSVGGINCTSTNGTASGTCSATLNSGAGVTLTPSAVPTTSIFAGWTGACSGTGACVISVGTSPVGVTATFSPAPESTLTVTTSGSGSVLSSPAGINCGATCSATFLNGTAVTLSASPASGFVFSGWSGSGCAGTGTCTVNMSANSGVTATFVPLYTLSVSVSGTGSVASAPAGISCGATCSATYSSGTSVSLAATPGSGQVFNGWSGACSGTGACTVTMGSNKAVTATFGPAPPPQYTTTLTTSGAVTGTVTSSPAGINCGATCSASFASGTSLTLTATPASGYVFAGWGGSACAGTGTCTYTVGSNTSVSANFVPQYTLSVALAGTGTGSVSSSPAGISCGATCSMTAAFGASISLAATPSTGQVFSGWSGACSGTGTCSVSMNANQSVTATFSPAPPPKYAVTVTLAGAGSGSVASDDASINCSPTCSASYASGTTVILSATPGTGSAFAGWSAAACSGTDTCTLTTNAAQAVTANFVPVEALFVNITGASGNTGTVFSNPAGIECPTQCAANYNQGTSITLNPLAASGYAFAGWGGACSGTGTCTVTMNGSQTVSVDFEVTKSVATPILTPLPTPYNFGTVQTATTSTQSVQISNTGATGAGNLIISAATVDNPMFGVPTSQFPMTIAPGNSHAMTMTFSPTATGASSGTISFTSNASNTSTTLPVSGNGSTTPSSGGFTVIPNSLYFGNVNVGTTVTQNLLMSNPGTGTTTVQAGTVTGSGFTIVSPVFPLTLAPGTSQLVTISFSPASSGAVTGVLTFTSDAAGANVVSLVASGNGTTPTTSATAVPTSLDFGTVPQGFTYYQTVTIYNTGNTSVSLNGATVTGAGFNVDNSVFPVTIPVNGSQSVTLSFTPVMGGTSSGSVTFSTNAPTSPTVGLTGTGGFVSAHRAVLTWAASNSSVVGYNVYRSTTSGSNYQKVSFVTSTSFTDSIVVSGQTYYWVVTAIDGSGSESGYSNEVKATIPNP